MRLCLGHREGRRSPAEDGLTESDFQLAARIQELDQPAQPA
jgi:hypothetical protein